jgi:hypothetical protein
VSHKNANGIKEVNILWHQNGLEFCTIKQHTPALLFLKQTQLLAFFTETIGDNPNHDVKQFILPIQDFRAETSSPTYIFNSQ